MKYGNVTATFNIPDGTTRNRANMNTQAYNQLADKIQNDPALKVWPFQWPPA
jgi:hypothetical protein